MSAPVPSLVDLYGPPVSTEDALITLAETLHSQRREGNITIVKNKNIEVTIREIKPLIR